MESMLHELVGKLVQIWSVRGESESSDIGILEAYDDHWVRLERSGENLYFSISRVRLINLL